MLYILCSDAYDFEIVEVNLFARDEFQRGCIRPEFLTTSASAGMEFKKLNLPFG